MTIFDIYKNHRESNGLDAPDTCLWLMESSNEDGPCAVECGRPVENDPRGLCPWHASAMAIPDDEFERRVEAGETWSR